MPRSIWRIWRLWLSPDQGRPPPWKYSMFIICVTKNCLLYESKSIFHSRHHHRRREDNQACLGGGDDVCQIGCLSSFGLVSTLGPLYRRLRKVDQCHHENHHYHHIMNVTLKIEVNVHSTRYRRVPCETNAHGPHVYEYCKVTQIWNRWPVKKKANVLENKIQVDPKCTKGTTHFKQAKCGIQFKYKGQTHKRWGC